MKKELTDYNFPEDLKTMTSDELSCFDKRVSY